MKTADKLIGISVGIALLTGAVSSCTDISGPTVNIYTPPARTAAQVIYESDGDITEQPEDDEPLPEDFITTGEASATTTAAQTSAFPVKSSYVKEISVGTGESTETTTKAAQTTTSAETTTTAAQTTTTAAQTTTTAAQTTTTAAQAAGTSEIVMQAEQPRTISYDVIGQNGILVSYQDGHYRGIMPCFGTYSMCERWANALNTFAAKLPGVDVYSLTVPVSSEFYTPKKFLDSGFTASQFNKTEHIREHLSGVRYIDGYSALAEHTAENIYSRTDHHWTPLGAYYAAQVFAKTAGIAFPDISEYKAVSRSGYVGSMYTYSKDYHLYNDAETFTMYLPPNIDKLETTYYNTSFGGAYKGDLFVSRNAASFYCSFLGSDDRIARIHTDAANGRTLVVFKQSYGNALIPFLTSGFENIYVCDMRYFELNGLQFCKDVGATDVMGTDCIMIAAGNGGKYLENLLTK